MTLELFHAPLSASSQKVRLVLAEKGLDWTSHLIDLMAGEQYAPTYLQLNPEGMVPTLVHDGRALVESSLINEYLEEAFPAPALRPEDPVERHRMRCWARYIDEHIHAACGLLTYAIGLRPMLLARPREQVAALIARVPDAARRAARHGALEHGIQAPGIPEAVRAHISLLERMEAALGGREWLVGERISLADAAVLPYVLRLEHLAMDALLSPPRRPRVAAWYQRMKARPAFTQAVTRFLPGAAVEAMRRAGQSQWTALEPLTRGPPPVMEGNSHDAATRA